MFSIQKSETLLNILLEVSMNPPKSSPGSVVSSTRRQWVTESAVAVGSLIFGSRVVWAADSDGLSHTAEAIHQETFFKVSRQRIYNALIDAQQFQKVQLLSGTTAGIDLQAKPAQISRETGGPFSIFGDYIVGRQLELVPGQRIVQAWREISWDPGIYSIVRFELKEHGSGTKLIFDHTGFPAGSGEHLAVGWKAHYWEPLEEFLS